SAQCGAASAPSGSAVPTVKFGIHRVYLVSGGSTEAGEDGASSPQSGRQLHRKPIADRAVFGDIASGELARGIERQCDRLRKSQGGGSLQGPSPHPRLPVYGVRHFERRR